MPAQPFGCRVQLAFVRRELLQSPDIARGADNRNPIPGLELFVNEALQRTANLNDALEGQPEVIHNHGDGPVNLRSRPDVRALGDLLWLAVLKNLKIFRPEVGHVPALSARNHGVHLDAVCGDAKYGLLRRLGE